MRTDRGCQVPLDEILGYLCDELATAEADRVEDHLFECGACARRLAFLERVREAVSGSVAAARLGGNVNRAFVERAARDGLSIRDYRIPEGETVSCQAGPEDLVVVRLAAELARLHDLQLDGSFVDLERQEESPLPTREVVADRDLDEVVLVFPGEVVRAYPRSRWTLRLRGEASSGPLELAPFVMDHHP